MQDELDQFTRNDVLSLVPRSEDGSIVRNKARLVAKGYNQEEAIDFDETYAPIAWLEAMRLLLAYAYICNFKLFQMDVKSAFLNGFFDEKVYVSQLPSFEITFTLTMFLN